MSKKLLTILLLVITVISLKIGINESVQANIDVNVTEKGSDVVMEKNFPKVKIKAWSNTKCEGFPVASFDQMFLQPNRVTCESTNIKKYNNVCVTTSLAEDEQGFSFEVVHPSGRFNFTQCPEGTDPQHAPPTWFANLEQEDKDKMVAFLSQAINQYGSFTEDVKQDLIAKFRIDDLQTEELYKFVYHSQPKCREKKFKGRGFDETCPQTEHNNFCKVPCSKHFVGETVKVKCTFGEWEMKKPICTARPIDPLPVDPLSPKVEYGLPGWAIAIIVIVVIAVIVVISWFCCCRKQQNSIQPNISPKQNLYTANLHPINQSPVYMDVGTPTDVKV